MLFKIFLEVVHRLAFRSVSLDRGNRQSGVYS